MFLLAGLSGFGLIGLAQNHAAHAPAWSDGILRSRWKSVFVLVPICCLSSSIALSIVSDKTPPDAVDNAKLSVSISRD
jgi:hypothetical protein